MSLPTFNGFSLQDSNFITERIVFKGYAGREVITAHINRREGIKLLSTEFGGKEITLEGNLIADSASDLQTKLDNMKKALTAEEGSLIIESDRTFTATVKNLSIPDEHYSQSKAPFIVTFICSNPFAEGSLQTVVTNVPSGLFTYSGQVNISGTMFARPTVEYIPPTGPGTGNTLIKTLSLTHTPTGQVLTVSGFNNSGGLDYSEVVTINMDSFSALEGSDEIDISGAFPRWQPGVNSYTITVSGRYPGGQVRLSYNPRYL